MNFFEAQDDARKKTGRLVVLFLAAIVSLIVLTNLLVAGVYVWTSNYAMPQQLNIIGLLTALPTETWVFISFGVIGVVGLAMLYKYMMVRGGGRTIAEALGGRQLIYDDTSGNTRRLLNIVEEMAIASGVPVPPVYLIPEDSINAFAAGFGPEDAVIGVNQGTIDLLSRDELQGVIAHEFSHILNGDVRINLRLVALLHGILFIGMIGYGILRGSGRGRRSNGGGAPVLALGVGLLVIGYAGTFFGNLIKAAVSRQREYLADAAAVQFTRNPDGIGGALKKIGGYSEGSGIDARAASEASHMFFGQVQRQFLNGLTATHPPLEKRIKAIDPRWNGEYPTVMSARFQPEGSGSEAVSAFAGNGREARSLSDVGDAYRDSLKVAPESIRLGADADAIADSVGRLDGNGLIAAQALIASTDPLLREAAHDPWGSRGLIYAILLDADPTLREKQFAYLQAEAEAGVPGHAANLIAALDAMAPPQQLALVDMAMPALKRLSRPQYDRFIANIVALIKMDRQITLPEWVLHRLLVKELKPHFEGPRRVRIRYGKLDEVTDAIAVLLSTLARFGHDDATSRAFAFRTGVEALELGERELTFEAEDDPNFSRLNEAIRTLMQLKPLAKPKLIKACAATTTADGHVSALEGALLQGVAAALDCPLPPSIYRAG